MALIRPVQHFEARFPDKLWCQIFDDLVPRYVKKHYSPKETWRDRPFDNRDGWFFFKGIKQLSEQFTEERSKIGDYFRHERFRSGYLLYFLPLQASKIFAIFDLHKEALEHAFREARKTGVLRIADLGAGPATASIALLLWILHYKEKSLRELFQLELHLVDSNSQIMTDGINLLKEIATTASVLDRIKITTQKAAWWETKGAPAHLVLLGHVLNEDRKTNRPQETSRLNTIYEKLVHPSGSGVLFIEPSSKQTSHQLSQIRDELLELNPEMTVWGPCLHRDVCPLRMGRDWCHFSMRAQVPGKMLKAISNELDSPKEWLKYSYIWLAAPEAAAPKRDASLRRVVSDPIPIPDRTKRVLLLCEPREVIRLKVPARTPIFRGDLIPYRHP